GMCLLLRQSRGFPVFLLAKKLTTAGSRADKLVICRSKIIRPVIRTFRSGWTTSRLSKAILKPFSFRWRSRERSSRPKLRRHAGGDVYLGDRTEAADQARARGAQPDQRRMLQQAGRLADEHQPKDLREPSCRGHAQARRPQHRGPRPQGAVAAGLTLPPQAMRTMHAQGDARVNAIFNA